MKKNNYFKIEQFVGEKKRDSPIYMAVRKGKSGLIIKGSLP
jgi:hypothetical protein